jgi:hypothetical protein
MRPMTSTVTPGERERESEVAGVEELCGNQFPTWHSLKFSQILFSHLWHRGFGKTHARDYIVKKS